MKREKDRVFNIIDIDSNITVEIAKTRKEIFIWMDEFIENLEYDWFDCDDVFMILYDNGTTDYIDIAYDGHKIKRQHISSMVYSNDCTYIVFGNFAMNEYGVVTTSFEEKIADFNIKEVKTHEAEGK